MYGLLENRVLYAPMDDEGRFGSDAKYCPKVPQNHATDGLSAKPIYREDSGSKTSVDRDYSSSSKKSPVLKSLPTAEEARLRLIREAVDDSAFGGRP